MQNRRAFLRLLGAGLGGTVLSSCGSSKHLTGGTAGTTPTGGSGARLPSGYGYTPVITTHASGDRGRSPGRDANPLDLDFMVPGSPMMNNQGQIIFYGGTQGSNGANQLTLDMSRGRTPRVTDARVLARQGQVLDGRVISHVAFGDTNKQGSFVVRAQAADEAPRVYLRQGPDGALEPILSLLDQLGGFQVGGAFGPTVLAGNGDILVVSSYSTDEGGAPQQGVLLLPGGSTNGAHVVANSGQAPPQIDAEIETFGLIDMNEAGNYVFQASVRRSIAGRAVEPDPRSPLMICGFGHVRVPITRARLLTASPRLGATRAEETGDTLFAPRVGPDGAVMRTVQVSEGHNILYYREIAIAETGKISPGGRVIKSVWPGVVNAVAGLCYYQLSCEGAEELCVTNGTDFRTLMTTGDMVEGKRVAGFLFGFCRESTDSEGRMCAQAWFTDGTTSIIVGVPV